MNTTHDADNTWTIRFSGYSESDNKKIEALTSIGNGYIGTRGAFEECRADDIHYPGTYLAGVYNRLTTKIAGREIENEDLVNIPNWLPIKFRIGDAEYIDIDSSSILQYEKILDMKSAVLYRTLRLKDKNGRIILIKSERFASMADPHTCTIRYTIIPENFSEKITIRAGIDGSVQNSGVKRYGDLENQHLAIIKKISDKNKCTLVAETTTSKIKIALTSIVRVSSGQKITSRAKEESDKEIYNLITVVAKEKQEIVFEKIVSIYASDDRDCTDPIVSSINSSALEKSFDVLFHEHKNSWDELWTKADILIDGDPEAQKQLRFNIYHLFSAFSHHNMSIDASVTARGLTGESYRGHIFWDTMYIFPFYFFHFPKIAKAGLMYRYQRLDEAKKAAQLKGLRGAMFPWHSGSDGREETQIIHLNPLSGKWDPDLTANQRHVSSAVAYNTWYYYWFSQDREFIETYGAEMMIEIALFWTSIAQYDEVTGRYSIDGVMGPDEFHEKIPGSKKPGLKDNAYTNIFASWVIDKALALKKIIPERFDELTDTISISKADIEEMKKISSLLKVHIHEGLVDQYDGFLKLKKIDFDKYKKKYSNIHRMDRILKAEGDSPDNYQLTKQADFLNIFYILPFSEVKKVFQRKGYGFEEEDYKKNFEYYLSCSSHGSTLSLIVHSYLAYMLGKEDLALDWFKMALGADLNDIQGGSTAEGIHTGVMAGTIYITLCGFAGFDFHGKHLSLDPKLPKKWKSIKFSILFKKCEYTILLTHEYITIDSPQKTIASIQGKRMTLKKGENRFRLK
ncbi:MAG: beta-phosphoglucomutase [Nanoarchaeota archaeon]|nr:beta-phosphoglucomutase [Nanoarchaeota archaeon]